MEFISEGQAAANFQQQQVKEGIDAVIVDNVLAIRQGLTAKATKVVGSSNWATEAAKVVNNAVDAAANAVEK